MASTIKDQKTIKSGNKKKALSKKKAPAPLTREKAFLFLSREGINPNSTAVFMNEKYKSLLKALVLNEMEAISDVQNSIDLDGKIRLTALSTHYIARMETLEILYIELHK